MGVPEVQGTVLVYGHCIGAWVCMAGAPGERTLGIHNSTVKELPRIRICLTMIPNTNLRQDNALMEKLHADGRFQPVSSPYEQGGGALQSAWVLPGEGIVADNTKGGFVYTFADTPPKWYPL